MKAISDYEHAQSARREEIKSEPSAWKRLWKTVWFMVAWPFRYLWAQCHDWRFFAIFAAVCAVASCEVWIPMSMSFFIAPIGWDGSMWSDLWNAINTHSIPSGTGTLKSSLFVTSITIWGIWWLPGTPFIPLCLAITMALRKIKWRKA